MASVIGWVLGSLLLAIAFVVLGSYLMALVVARQFLMNLESRGLAACAPRVCHLPACPCCDHSRCTLHCADQCGCASEAPTAEQDLMDHYGTWPRAPHAAPSKPS